MFPRLQSFASSARRCGFGFGLAALLAASSLAQPLRAPDLWPQPTATAKPWTYWWWMASAVDTNNISKELTRYRDAGLGGVHIIPIYGAKGWETNAIPYLSPKWMDMLAFTVAEANRLGLGVDMTTGTGWCFGGPRVTDAEANASVVWQTYTLPANTNLTLKFAPKTTQAIVAYPEGQPPQDLTSKLSADGTFTFAASSVPSVLYVVSQRPSGQKVKRPSPGGEGHMLNLASPAAMTNYLHWFDDAFASYTGPKPRAQYHDSYEYRTDWSPEFLAEFEKRRGYRLQDELPALFANAQPPRSRDERDTPPPAGPPVDADRIARVKCDYRETISDLMVEVTLPMWAAWSHTNGFLTRNEAHGSPGNWLDLYAAADIPETEMFHLDRNKLISKFASSAAHVTGKNLVSSETGTWLAEHFTETLADMKYLLDDLFLSGVNHVFYHGTCYSPDEAPWPGWLFYASYQMNPRNPVWRDVPALNAYAARCQAVLQSGKPDNDILLYWPIHDFWSSTNGLARNMTVHARDWFEEQPVGKLAKKLWEYGYAFDYVSDAQLKTAKVVDGKIQMPGGTYQVIVVPKCTCMPFGTFKRMLTLATNGAPVVFEEGIPSTVSGFADLEKKQAQFDELKRNIKPTVCGKALEEAVVGKGRLLFGSSTSFLGQLARADHGLSSVRRAMPDGRVYFLANQTQQDFKGWVSLAGPTRCVVAMNPMNGNTGLARFRIEPWLMDDKYPFRCTEVFLELAPGESVILRTFHDTKAEDPACPYWETGDRLAPITGDWKVRFLTGGPEYPAPFTTDKLDSWAKLGDTNAQRFAGTALYSSRFDRPAGEATHWQLDLGKVSQSARVRLNGADLGSFITPPFRVVVNNLNPTDNLLEVEVTSTAANRIRDMDRRGVKWKNFHDINFVNLDYKPFDASNWPLADAGLLGPVTLTPVASLQPK